MSDLESRFSELVLQVSTMKAYTDNDRCLLHKAMADLAKMTSSCDAIVGALSNYASQIKDTLYEFAKLQELVATIRAEFARHHHALSETVKSSLDQKLNLFAVLSADLVMKVDKFEKTLEEISIDSKNAVLKSNNADMVTMLNKKKIEHACLLVQNMQLKK